MPTYEEIRTKIDAARANMNDKIGWESELKIILNDIVDSLESAGIEFSNGISDGKLGGELSEPTTTITIPEASETTLSIGTITEANNGGILFDLANSYESSNHYISFISMAFAPGFQQGSLLINTGGLVGDATNDTTTSIFTVIPDSITFQVTHFESGNNSQILVGSSALQFISTRADFDAFLKAKSYQYTAFEDIATALSNIPEEQRTPGMTFLVENTMDDLTTEWMFESGITDGHATEKNSRYFRGKKFTGPTYTDDTDAGTEGLTTGDIYMRATGELAVKL